MKKLLLAAAATAAFSSSAFADNEYYLRADAGYNKFNDLKVSGLGTMKGKYSPSMDLGVGYNVMDNVRAELVYGYQFSPTHKYSGTVNNVKSSSKLKTKIHTLMVKGYADVADLGVAQIFAGAGVGMAQKSSKATISGSSVNLQSKKNNTFTYSLALGSAFDVADSVKMDVQYNFQDFGKDAAKGEKKSFRSHAIKAGVRFAL